MIQWISTHGIELLIGYYLFNAMVSGMPEPMPNGGQAYLWAYRSLHSLSGNLDKLVKTKGINLDAPTDKKAGE